ncbi:MAG: sugar ABC transporter permease [Actinomycetota bacterium]|nr:sugar ABC transporter permease [Actinomycetota bacterium]
MIERETAVRGVVLRAPPPWRRGFSLRALAREYSVPLLFMAPMGLVVVVAFLIPVLLTVFIGLTNMSVATGVGGWDFIGLANFRQMLRSPFTPLILKNTLFFVALTLLFNVGLALVLAILTTLVPDRPGTLFRSLWLLPRITPSVVYIMMWKYFTADEPFGIVAQAFSMVGIETSNLMRTSPWLIIVTLSAFIGASLGMIIFTSAIRSIPRDYYLAAQVDGASTWQQVGRITIPMLRWPIMFVMAYQTLSLLTTFEYILLATNGGPGFYTTEVWSLYAFHNAFSNYFGNTQFGFGSALAAVLVVIGLVASILYLKFFRFGAQVHRPRIEVN